jgi:hypothetical protein
MIETAIVGLDAWIIKPWVGFIDYLKSNNITQSSIKDQVRAEHKRAWADQQRQLRELNTELRE